MNSLQAVSAVPGTDQARLPCRAHAPGYGKEQGSLPAAPSAPQEAAHSPRPASGAISSGSRLPRHAGTAHRRRIAGRAVTGLYGLGFASGSGAAAANGDVAGRLARRDTVFRRRASLFLAPIQALVSDQADAAGSAFCRPGMGATAVQSPRAGVSAEGAMVARGSHWRSRRGAAGRGDRGVLGTPGARYAGAIQFRRDQPGSA